MTLYALILMACYLYLPIVGEEVVLPYGVLLIGGVPKLTLNSLLGVPGVVLLIFVNILPFHARWRATMNITSLTLMTLSIMFLFLRDPTHNTWNTFTSSRLSYVFYLSYTGISILFIRKNMTLLEVSAETPDKT